MTATSLIPIGMGLIVLGVDSIAICIATAESIAHSLGCR